MKRSCEYTKANNFLFPLIEHICKPRCITTSSARDLFIAECESCRTRINNDVLMMSAAMITTAGHATMTQCPHCGSDTFVGTVKGLTDAEIETLKKDKFFSTLLERVEPKEPISEKAAPFLVENFTAHFERVRRDTPAQSEFIDRHLQPSQVLSLAELGASKLELMLADQNEHSVSTSDGSVYFEVCLLPVHLSEGRAWYANRHGGYIARLDNYLNSDLFKQSKCSSLCHIMFGLCLDVSNVSLGGQWVNMTVFPIPKLAPSYVGVLLPSDLMTADERRDCGI